MHIDKNGYLKLSKEALELLSISEHTNLRLVINNDCLIIKRSVNCCIFCNSTIDLIGIGEHFVCCKCRDKLSKTNSGEYIY